MKIGFIGCGKMGEAMVAALINSRLVVPHEVFASDVSADRRRTLKRRYGINTYSKNHAIVGLADILFLAIKPQHFPEVLDEVAPLVTKKHLVISIAAGKTIEGLRAHLEQARIIRVMPNLACTVGAGMSVFTAHAAVTTADRQVVTRLLSCFGEVLELPEVRFDAVTALSGSGPAFFAYFLSCMIEAGIAEGLKPEEARLLARQTMLGTARVLIENRVEPLDLIASVASKKGTTEAGMKVLEESELADVLKRTIAAAARRSKHLSG